MPLVASIAEIQGPGSATPLAGRTVFNGDESIAFQYSRRNYSVVDFYSPDPFASSDHDPDLVGISTTK